MEDELSPEEFEEAKLHEQNIRHIEWELLSTLNGGMFWYGSLEENQRAIEILAKEQNIEINPKVWGILYEPAFGFSTKYIIETIAKNPNPSIPAEVFDEIYVRCISFEQQIWTDHNENLCAITLNSTNPNFPHILLNKLLAKTIVSLKGPDLEYVDKEQTSINFSKIFGSKNPLLKWKNASGNHKLLQFLNTNTYAHLIVKIGPNKFAELPVILANNIEIHTPDLIEKLLELAKKNKKLNEALITSGSDCIPVKYISKENVNVRAIKFLTSFANNANHFFGEGENNEKVKMVGPVGWGLTKIFNCDNSNNFNEIIFYLPKNSEIYNLAQTFENLLDALKFARLQSEQFRLANISALRAKLEKDSFENLMDIRNENSIPKLFISVANKIQNLDFFQRNFTERGLIQEFEKIVNSFRFDLIKNAGLEGCQYQLCFEFMSNQRNNQYFDEQMQDMFFGSDINKVLEQNYIQEGQNPKELIDALVQLQKLLIELKSKITKIPIVELTAEQIQIQQFYVEALQYLELLSMTLPDLTDIEIFKTINPSTPIPANVENYEWLIDCIDCINMNQTVTRIENQAKTNLAQNKSLASVLNVIFYPDQSIERALADDSESSTLIIALWSKVQEIQATYNGLKADKNELDKSDKRYSIFYKAFSRILLEKLNNVYKEIYMLTNNETLSKIARDKIGIIGEYLGEKQI